jgi:two-component system chemotaxis response regulator CheY
MRFLVIDNSTLSRRAVVNTVKSFGYDDIVEAEDGMDGLSKIKDKNVDIILTEWEMPNLSGLELTKLIRKSESWRDIPVIMISSKGLKSDIVEALKAKVNHYIVKPINPKSLKEKINSYYKPPQITEATAEIPVDNTTENPNNESGENK